MPNKAMTVCSLDDAASRTGLAASGQSLLHVAGLEPGTTEVDLNSFTTQGGSWPAVRVIEFGSF